MHEIYMCYIYRKHIGAYKLKLCAHIYMLTTQIITGIILL